MLTMSEMNFNTNLLLHVYEICGLPIKSRVEHVMHLSMLSQRQGKGRDLIDCGLPSAGHLINPSVLGVRVFDQIMVQL